MGAQLSQALLSVSDVLDLLERHFGAQSPCWPLEPYDFLIWWHCGYPASDANCARGWEALTTRVGIEPDALLQASEADLGTALRHGGIVPELRALRLKEIAMRVQSELGGDLRAALHGPITAARKLLKRFPNIADAGADRILLFARLAPVAAVPSNCPHVLSRILFGHERDNYSLNYCEAQQAIADELPAAFPARQRAYLLLKRHGQELCKRTKPLCHQCPVESQCAYFKRTRAGCAGLASSAGTRAETVRAAAGRMRPRRRAPSDAERGRRSRAPALKK